jgi:hypothetical protein
MQKVRPLPTALDRDSYIDMIIFNQISEKWILKQTNKLITCIDRVLRKLIRLFKPFVNVWADRQPNFAFLQHFKCEITYICVPNIRVCHLIHLKNKNVLRQYLRFDKHLSEKCLRSIANRTARWYVFKPKIQLWVNFGRPWNEKKLVYYMAICNKLQPFGIF